MPGCAHVLAAGCCIPRIMTTETEPHQELPSEERVRRSRSPRSSSFVQDKRTVAEFSRGNDRYMTGDRDVGRWELIDMTVGREQTAAVVTNSFG